VHYKHLRPTLQLPLNFKLFSYLTHMRNISRATIIKLDFIVNWRVSVVISLEVSLSLKLLVSWKEFLIKICLKLKDTKDNSVQWADWDSNRQCPKFDKVVKHSSSTETITANNLYQYIIQPSHHFLQTFRSLRMFKIASRDNSLYPQQLSLFCLLCLISAGTGRFGYITNFSNIIELSH